MKRLPLPKRTYTIVDHITPVQKRFVALEVKKPRKRTRHGVRRTAKPFLERWPTRLENSSAAGSVPERDGFDSLLPCQVNSVQFTWG